MGALLMPGHKMRDYAVTDARSVASQFQGNGDGRPTVWRAYRLASFCRIRKVDESEIALNYEAFCKRWFPVTEDPLKVSSVVASILRRLSRRLDIGISEN